MLYPQNAIRYRHGHAFDSMPAAIVDVSEWITDYKAEDVSAKAPRFVLGKCSRVGGPIISKLDCLDRTWLCLGRIYTICTVSLNYLHIYQR